MENVIEKNVEDYNASTTVDSTLLRIGTCPISAQKLLALLKRCELLPKLQQEILIDEAIAPIHCTTEEQIECCQAFCDRHQLTSEDKRQAWLQQQDISEDQYVDLATRSLRTEKFKQAQWKNKVNSYFLKNKQHLDQITYSMIRTRNAEVVRELFFRLQEGEQSFATLAQEYSEGTEAKSGGLIGPVTLNNPHPTLAKLLTNCQPGQLIPPTRIEEWWVIVRLEELRSAQLDELMEQRLLDKLFSIWLKEQLNQLTTIHPENTLLSDL